MAKIEIFIFNHQATAKPRPPLWHYKNFSLFLASPLNADIVSEESADITRDPEETAISTIQDETEPTVTVAVTVHQPEGQADEEVTAIGQ